MRFLRDVFLRARTIVLALFFMVLVTTLLVFPSQVVELARAIQDQPTGIRVLLFLVALLADAGLAFVIYREVWEARAGGLGGILVYNTNANVQITLESVRENLDEALEALDGLINVDTRMTSERGRINILLNITARDDVDVRRKTKDINNEIERVVEKQMGVRLASRPVINFQLHGESGQAAAKPLPTEAFPATPLEAEAVPSAAVVPPAEAAITGTPETTPPSTNVPPATDEDLPKES